MIRISLSIYLLASFYVHSQHQDKVDFIHAEVFIEPIPENKQINGFVTYEFEVLQDIDSVFLDAKNMEFRSVTLDGKRIKNNNNGKIISVRKRLKKGKKHRLRLEYSCTPKQTVYFIGGSVISGAVEELGTNTAQIWTQGQGKYTSHWLPSFDDMEEKVEFDLNIIVKNESNTITIANGELKETAIHLDSLKRWTFDMQKPMSSYLLAFAIGKYNKQELTSKSGIPIENYYYPQDSLKVEPTYRYTKEIFDFLEAEIGVPYPWQNYKQVPVKDFLYAGMENTTATIFSDAYVIDSTSFADKNYVNVNAHELAHQWFGNLVTEKDGNHHWLHEGFATYYAYLAEMKIFGEDHFYWKLYRSLLELQNTVDRGEGQSLLNPKASSQTFYEKGAWALYMLRSQIGDMAFKAGIKNYLEKYQFKNVTVSDFLTEMELTSKTDLSNYKKDWLDNKSITFEAAKKQLKTDAPSLAFLFSMEQEFKDIKSDDLDIAKYWNGNPSIHLKKYILDRYYKIPPDTILQKAFASDTIQLRQQLAKRIDSIPLSFKTEFESLLSDKSYITVENALFKLWVAYPEERFRFLDKTKDIYGLPNKNVRLLWLTLAMLTNGYNSTNMPVYFQELTSYTTSKYGWELRMGAFQYLEQTIGLNDESLKSLINACIHHSWQFKKYARSLLDRLLQDPDYSFRIKVISKVLSGKESEYLNTKLKKE